MKNGLMPGFTLVAVLLAAHGFAAEAVYPVRVSDNGRYIIDQQGKPVFWLGTTQWQLFRNNKLEEERETIPGEDQEPRLHLRRRSCCCRAGGAMGRKGTSMARSSWTSLDPLTPNEAYFRARRCRAQDRPRKQRGDFADRFTINAASVQGHHPEERAPFAKWLGEVLQGRAQHCVVDDAGGQEGVCSQSCGSWRRGSTRAMAAPISSPSSPTRRRIRPASSMGSLGSTSTPCRRGRVSN